MGALPPLDKDGYLAALEDWSPAVAELLAVEEGIELGAEHWEIIELLRAFHARYELSPDNRALVKATRQALGPEKGRSIHLMRLFGGSPAKTGARIAGLPRPTNCL
ncbi:MAG: TusE/DsrC/DsvC family sulfur relay protein [Pseudomonadales bacterium]|jgi:tRNA 2-thiouridine synthesizing protein E|nr:TusE/DsrC/DsvC family sulfur relay protein [Pseudomonadales bacterium]